jgi:hypothetical protein
MSRPAKQHQPDHLTLSIGELLLREEFKNSLFGFMHLKNRLSNGRAYL